MSGLLFLTRQDFKLTKGTKGRLLSHSIPGFSLILFYSIQCDHCNKLIPIFKSLPGTIGGCVFGMVNVGTSKDREIVSMSNSTITPITYVPYIILYVNGKPFMQYNGPHIKEEIRRFVLEVAEKVKSKQKFQSENVKEDVDGRGIPAYTIGYPLYGDDDRTYLEFDEAYVKNKK